MLISRREFIQQAALTAGEIIASRPLSGFAKTEKVPSRKKFIGMEGNFGHSGDVIANIRSIRDFFRRHFHGAV